MKRKSDYRFFILVLLTIWSVLFFSGDLIAQTESVTFQATVLSTRVPLNQTTNATIEISWKGHTHRFDILQTDPPILTNFKLIGSASSTSIETDPAGIPTSKTTLSYELQPLEIGMGYLEPVTITYMDRADSSQHKLFSQRLGIEVIPPISKKTGRFLWLGIVLTLVGIAGGVKVGLDFYKKRRDQERKSIEKAVEVSLEEKYYQETKKLVQAQLPNFKEAVSQLSKVLRYYLSEKYNRKFTGFTTDEIVTQLQKEIGEGPLKVLENFMRRSDVIQFANSPVEQSEFDYLYRQIETFLLRSEKYQITEPKDENS